jgi:hypothetical protein
MPLPHDEIAAISADVIRQYGEPLKFVGIMASEGGSNRVELMVTIRGCHDEPCRFLLNLSRGDRATLASELVSSSKVCCEHTHCGTDSSAAETISFDLRGTNDIRRLMLLSGDSAARAFQPA